MKKKKNMKKKTRYIVSHEYIGKDNMRTAFEQVVEIGMQEQNNSAPAQSNSE